MGKVIEIRGHPKWKERLKKMGVIELTERASATDYVRSVAAKFLGLAPQYADGEWVDALTDELDLEENRERLLT